MAKVNKSFWIEKNTSRKFKSRCAELDLRNSEVVEQLMIKWLNKTEKWLKKDQIRN